MHPARPNVAALTNLSRLAIVVFVLFTFFLNAVNPVSAKPLNAVISFSNTTPVTITDSTNTNCAFPAGTVVTSTIYVPNANLIRDINVTLDISHERVGDLIVTLTSPAGTTVTLINRPGSPGDNVCGFNSANITTTLDDESTGGAVEDANPPTGASYTPNEPLSGFDVEAAAGTWTLSITDTMTGAVGTLNSWSMEIDMAPVVLIQSGGTTAVTEGGAADSYSFQLESMPTADVTITADPDTQCDLGAGAGSPVSLTFTSSNYALAQTFSVTAVNDNLREDVHTCTITNTMSTTDPDYSTVVGLPTINVSITDNDTAGITMSPAGGGLAISEGGTTDFFSLVLTSQPRATVSIAIRPGTQCSVGAGIGVVRTITFSTTNWAAPVTILVTALNDNVVEGNHSCTIGFTVTSTDVDYSSRTISNITAAITDNDTAGITIYPVGTGTTTVAEGGRTDSYTVVLTSQPTSTVTFTARPNNSQCNLGAGPGTSQVLTFTTTNWNTIQTISVSAVDDAIVETSQSCVIAHSSSSADGNYNGKTYSSITVAITDNDTAGIVLLQSGDTTAVTEGGAGDSYTLGLTSQPAADVVITADPGPRCDLGAGVDNPVTRTFTSANFGSAQTVVVNAEDNLIVEGEQTCTITHTVASSDTRYNGLSVANVDTTITDNDVKGIVLTQSSGTTTISESGATDSYSLHLRSEPQAPVMVTVEPDRQCNVGAGDGAPLTVALTSYSQPATIIVSAVNDTADEGTHTCVIRHSVTSSDSGYNGLLLDNVTATVMDNDTGQSTLGTPRLLFPYDRANIINLIPRMTWTAVSGTNQYRMQIDDDPTFGSPVERGTGSRTNYQFTVNDGLSYGVTYYWRVQSGNSTFNWSQWSAVRVFTITNLLNPKNASYGTLASPTFSWTAVLGALNYEFQLDDDPGFGSPQVTSSGKLLKYSIPYSNPLPLGKYYWRVCTLLPNGQKPCMQPWTTTITATLPPAPTLVLPTDLSLLGVNNPQFTWLPLGDWIAGGPFTYQIQIDKDSLFRHPEQDYRQVESVFTTAPLPDGTYFWRVRAINTLNTTGIWSKPRRFVIDTTPPAAPRPLTPGSYSNLTIDRPKMTWLASATATKYRLLIGTLDSCDAPQTVIGPLSTTYYQLTAAEALVPGRYCWKVSASDAVGNWSNPSTAFYMTVSSSAVTLPGKPVLVGPASAAYQTTTTPTFTWQAADPALAFQIQVAAASTFAQPAVEQEIAAGETSYTLTSPLRQGKYFWRLRMVNEQGVSGPWSDVRNFIVDSIPPATPVTLLPLNNSLVSKTRPAFSWKSVTGSVAYRIQIARDVDFTDLLIEKQQTTLSFVPPTTAPLDFGEYYWRVQSQDAAGNGSPWSSAAKFTVTLQKSPFNGAVVTTQTPVFTWVPLLGASYNLEVASSCDFKPEEILAMYSGTATTYTPTNLLPAGQLCWRVKANDMAMPAWILVITPELPPTPTQISPADKALVASPTPIFRWTSVLYGSSYQIQISTDLGFTTLAVDTSTTELEYTPDGLPDGTYYWRVRAVNSQPAAGKWSLTRTLRIDNTAPGVPVPLTPLDGATLTNPQLTFTWSAADGAAGYEFRLETSQSFSLPPASLGLVTSYKSLLPLSNGVYYWQVRAVDAAGNVSEWSDVRTFEVVLGLLAPAPIESDN